jgi:uncharacterized membrane protein
VTIDPLILLTLVGMALATALARAGGFLLMRWVPLTPPVQRWMRALPSAVIAAVVAPTFALGGWPERIALCATILAMRLFGSELGAVAAGIAAVVALRQFV